MGFPISSYQANVPQLDAEVDRVKAKAQGVPLTAQRSLAIDTTPYRSGILAQYFQPHP